MIEGEDLGGLPPWLAARMDGDVLTDDQLLEMGRWAGGLLDRALEDFYDEDSLPHEGGWHAFARAFEAREAYYSEILKRQVADRCGLGTGPQRYPLRAR